jgi:hypothetical protein
VDVTGDACLIAQPFSGGDRCASAVVILSRPSSRVAERWFLPAAERERHEEQRHAPFPAEEYV